MTPIQPFQHPINYGLLLQLTAPPSTISPKITWIADIDIGTEQAGPKILKALPPKTSISTLIITAGYFHLESFDSPSFSDEVTMYKTSAIGPVFIVHHLFKGGVLAKGSKIILVSSESGSIALRAQSEGGGAYGHHARKAALNMVGKLLSLDLKEDGIAVGLVHPGFMRTEMTKGVGFDKFYDDGGGGSFRDNGRGEGDMLTPWVFDSCDARRSRGISHFLHRNV